MSALTLRSELNGFNEHLSKIRRLLTETCEVFEEIEQTTQISGVKLSGETFYEEADLRDRVNSPPCIVILGQNQECKAKLVNRLFGEMIYPSVAAEAVNSRWRMVRFKYGRRQTVGLSLPDQYELVDNLVAYDRPWKTLPVEDISIQNVESAEKTHAVLDVQLSHALLKTGLDIVVSEHNTGRSFVELMKDYLAGICGVCLYAVASLTLSDQEVENLAELEEHNLSIPFLFVNMNEEASSDLLKNSQSLRRLGLHEQLGKVGLVSMLPTDEELPDKGLLSLCVQSEICESLPAFNSQLCVFARAAFRHHLVSITSILNLVHQRSLNSFIMRAFDMQRDMLITPKRLEFARTKELELSETLLQLASDKQEEIRQLVMDAIRSIRETISTTIIDYGFIGVNFTEDQQPTSFRDFRICSGQIRELVIGKLNHAIAGKLVQSVNFLRESYVGTLTRCIESLEQEEAWNDSNSEVWEMEDRLLSNDNALRRNNATSALRQILNAAYHVDININNGSTLLKNFMDKIKQLVHSFPWHTQPKIDNPWKVKVACDMLASLNEAKLAKSVGEQFKDRLKQSHEKFSSALRQLEMHHTGRLEKAEERRQKLRKVHAPKVARLAMESSSLKDYIIYGIPVCGREIGRGQYGVVYSCEEWAGIKPCAVKSVVPPDDKHMNDLALEFYYTKNVPQHDRIVGVKGSVIDYSYGGGSSPAVLIIMERMQRDFYAAIKAGMDWLSRLQVSIDVVEGIRYLHSQGLVHRDIKLKNVLLTQETNRGKITDLGFCKPEAMMSGSIVGTPIHMAPELFNGYYDNSVDVYAFGILFWYVCAGHVKLPKNFEQCNNKDQLFTSVKRGVRPEHLPQFDTECWQLMVDCWESVPTQRALVGTIHTRLQNILDAYRNNPEQTVLKNMSNQGGSASKPRRRHDNPY